MSNLLEQLAARLDLPADALAGTTKVTLTGMEQVLIENHRGLLAYSDTLVEVDARTYRIRVQGDGLLLRAMNEDMLLICGRVFCVDMG